MPRLGWHWVLLVWGYAIIWFLITDRVKLAAYKILDPVKNQGTAPAGPPAAEPGSPPDLPGKAAATAQPAAFHTDTDPGDLVYPRQQRLSLRPGDQARRQRRARHRRAPPV